MKNILCSAVAAFALTLTSAAFAQSAPSSDKAPPPPSGSPGSESTVSPSNGSDNNKADTAKKAGKSKQGSDTNGDKPAPSKY